jgi:hypothetical protein
MELAPKPERLDFAKDINNINRTTSDMIFSALKLIPRNGQRIHDLLYKATSLDWTDATHTITATYVPSPNNKHGSDEYTTLSILVQLAKKTSVEVTVDLIHQHRKYVHYVPTNWNIDIIHRGHPIRSFEHTWGITAVVLRQLIMQYKITLEIAADKAKGCYRPEYHDYTKKNSARWEEELWTKFGLIHLIEYVIYPAYDPSYAGPQLIIQL